MCLCSLKYQTLMPMRSIVIHGKSGSIRFFHISQTERFSKKTLCNKKICVLIFSINHYEVWQFNSRNGPVKPIFAYLCSSGCCRLRNTLLVKLCTSWDDGATAGNSLENRFPEYLAVMFSCCTGCQKGQQIFVFSGHFLILEKAKNRRGLSQVNKVDGPFL